MDYEFWKQSEVPESGKGCFNCKDKFCNGEQCAKFLGYRLTFLKDLLTTATGIRKEHLLTSINKAETKLKELSEIENPD